MAVGALAAAAVAVALAIVTVDNIGNVLFSEDFLPKPADEQPNDVQIDESEHRDDADYGVLETTNSDSPASRVSNRFNERDFVSMLAQPPKGSADPWRGGAGGADTESDPHEQSSHTEVVRCRRSG